MTIAITRQVSDAINRCEITHISRHPIDVALARRQHEDYVRCLATLGVEVVQLPQEPDLPDSVFVEDIAVVTPEVAVLTNPGAEPRRGEVASVAVALAPYRPLAFIEPPGTLDGGDVLILDRRVLVGLSSRSNDDGLRQLRAHLAPHGYTVEGVATTGCLHLKSAVTRVAPGTVLLNPEWVDEGTFEGWTRIAVDPFEAHAANALEVRSAVIYPAAFPRTARRLEEAGIALVRIDVSELAKAEGAVTCCSLIVAP